MNFLILSFDYFLNYIILSRFIFFNILKVVFQLIDCLILVLILIVTALIIFFDIFSYFF